MKSFLRSKLDAIESVLMDCGHPHALASQSEGLIENAGRTDVTPGDVKARLVLLSENDQRPEVGLIAGARMKITYYGALGYAWMCAEDFESVLRIAIKYARLTGSFADFSWEIVDDSIVWYPTGKNTTHIEYSKSSAVLRDFQFCTDVTLIKQIMGSDFVPSRIVMRGKAVAHSDVYPKYLGANVEFGSQYDAIYYPKAFLKKAPGLSNPIAATDACSACESLLHSLQSQADYSYRICEIFNQCHGEFPSIEEVARTLCVSSRTLHRKLKAEGTSFMSLLQNFRFVMADQMLRTGGLPIETVARTLGYSTGSSFTRAFKAWRQASGG